MCKLRVRIHVFIARHSLGVRRQASHDRLFYCQIAAASLARAVGRQECPPVSYRREVVIASSVQTASVACNWMFFPRKRFLSSLPQPVSYQLSIHLRLSSSLRTAITDCYTRTRSSVLNGFFAISSLLLFFSVTFPCSRFS